MIWLWPLSQISWHLFESHCLLIYTKGDFNLKIFLTFCCHHIYQKNVENDSEIFFVDNILTRPQRVKQLTNQICWEIFRFCNLTISNTCFLRHLFCVTHVVVWRATSWCVPCGATMALTPGLSSPTVLSITCPPPCPWTTLWGLVQGDHQDTDG